MAVLTRLKAHPSVRRAVGVARVSAHVEDRARFLARELGRRGEGTYRLAGSPLRARIRHGSEDVWVLGEVFGGRVYEPPSAVRATLDARGPALDIVDLGGHVGLFALWALGTWPQARVHSVEADPGNAATLRRAIAANGLDARWTLEHASAGTAPGHAEFRASGGSGSRLAEFVDGSVPTVRVPVVDVLPRLERADLAKIDIEGAEWPILSDPRLRETQAAALVMEVHAHGAPAEDFASAAHALLRDAGFTTSVIPDPPHGAAMLWAWRERQA